MKTIFVMCLLIAVTTLTTVQASARMDCMATVLDHAIKDYQQKLATTGIVATRKDSSTGYEDQIVNLGKELREESVIVQDNLKNSYRIKIPLQYVSHMSSRLVLVTSVSIENYTSCVPTSDELTYRVYKEVD